MFHGCSYRFAFVILKTGRNPCMIIGRKFTLLRSQKNKTCFGAVWRKPSGRSPANFCVIANRGPSLIFRFFRPNPPRFWGVKTERPLGVRRKLLLYMLPLSLKQGCSPKKEVGAPKTRLRQRFLNNLGLHTCTLIHVRKIATADL